MLRFHPFAPQQGFQLIAGDDGALCEKRAHWLPSAKLRITSSRLVFEMIIAPNSETTRQCICFASKSSANLSARNAGFQKRYYAISSRIYVSSHTLMQRNNVPILLNRASVPTLLLQHTFCAYSIPECRAMRQLRGSSHLALRSEELIQLIAGFLLEFLVPLGLGQSDRFLQVVHGVELVPDGCIG